MTIDDKIRDEKLQYDFNKEVAKISVLSHGIFDKSEYLTCEEVLTSNQKQRIEQAKFAIFSFTKSVWKMSRKTGWRYRTSRPF